MKKILLALAIFLCAAPLAHAHKVSIFAWVEQDTVYTISKFSGGKYVKHGKVSVFDEQKNKLLEKLSIKDELTGLYNYRYFREHVSSEFQRAVRYRMELCCAILDIDFFKKVNDTYGHQAGDATLKNVAKILMGSIRKTDTVARYGGEEFVFLFAHTSFENAILLSERIREAIQASAFHYDSFTIKVTASIGVASVLDNNPQTVEDLIRFADNALYKAKNSGRNRVIAYKRGEE